MDVSKLGPMLMKMAQFIDHYHLRLPGCPDDLKSTIRVDSYAVLRANLGSPRLPMLRSFFSFMRHCGLLSPIVYARPRDWPILGPFRDPKLDFNPILRDMDSLGDLRGYRLQNFPWTVERIVVMFSLWSWAFDKAVAMGVIQPRGLSDQPNLASSPHFMGPKPFQCHPFAIIKEPTPSLPEKLLSGGGVDAFNTMTRRHHDNFPVKRARTDAHEGLPPATTTTQDATASTSVADDDSRLKELTEDEIIAMVKSHPPEDIYPNLDQSTSTEDVVEHNSPPTTTTHDQPVTVNLDAGTSHWQDTTTTTQHTTTTTQDTPTVAASDANNNATAISLDDSDKLPDIDGLTQKDIETWQASMDGP